MPKTISQLPAAASANPNAVLAADNASGTLTERVTLGQVASLAPVQTVAGRSGNVMLGVSDVTGLQTALDEKAASSHSHSAADITSGTLADARLSANVPLLTSGLIPSAFLPSYVDDVLEFTNLAAFPGTGMAGKIYVALDTNRIYRWSGSVYIEISPSPGSTDSVTEGVVNLYHTTARASAAAPVQSVAGRTGAVTLSVTDVAGAVSTSDGRLSDARAPTGAAGGDLAGTFPSPVLAPSGVTAGVYTSVTVDAKGRVTAGSTPAIAYSSLTGIPTTFTPPVASSTVLGGVKQGANVTIAADGTLSATTSGSIGGPAGGDLAGTYPNPSLANTGVTAGSYGSGTAVPAITVDAKGRITAASSTSIFISTAQVSGLGTIATQDADNVALTGGSIVGITDLAIQDGGTGASTAAAARTNLGLAIGTDVQQQNANLQAIASQATAADRLSYWTGSGAAALATITSIGRGILQQASATGVRNYLSVPYGNSGAISLSGGGAQWPLEIYWNGTASAVVDGALEGTYSAISTRAIICRLRGWANFDGVNNDNLTGTYSQTGTTVTVTISGAWATTSSNGIAVGHQIYADVTSGTGVDGLYAVTATNETDFTLAETQFRYTAATSLTTSGNITIRRCLIRASNGVSSVTDNGTGDYIVNLQSQLPDNEYSVQLNAQRGDSANMPALTALRGTTGNALTSTNTNNFRIGTYNTAGTAIDCIIINIAVFR